MTELPFGLKGKIFRSAMPFCIFDEKQTLFSRFQKSRVSVVLVLAGRVECLERTGIDLIDFYHKRGLQVIHLPIPDFGVPSKTPLKKILQRVIRLANDGQNIAVHCFAGVGRTGTIAACLAGEIFGDSGEQAIRRVRTWIGEGSVETHQQKKFVLEYCKEAG
jgi:polymorphic toxin system DSP-PTPase phosphatase-like protein